MRLAVSIRERESRCGHETAPGGFEVECEVTGAMRRKFGGATRLKNRVIRLVNMGNIGGQGYGFE